MQRSAGLCASLLVSLGLIVADAAFADPRDGLLLSMQVESVDGDPGVGAALNWWRASDDRTRWSAGLAAYELEEVRWGFLSMGSSFRASDRVWLSLEVEWGKGERADATFDYLVGRAHVDTNLTPTLRLRGSAITFDVDAHRATLAGGTLTIESGALAFGIFAYAPIDGTSETSGGVRVDGSVPSGGWYVGAATGMLESETIIDSRITSDSVELFGGFTPSRSSVSFHLRVVSVEQTERLSLLLGWRLR